MALVVLAGIMAASPAQAGFQWLAPGDSGTAPSGARLPSVMVAPQPPAQNANGAALNSGSLGTLTMPAPPLTVTTTGPTGSPEVISPIVIGGAASTPQAPANSATTPDSNGEILFYKGNADISAAKPATPVIPPSSASAPPPAPAKGTLGTLSASENSDAVRGFAKNVPLVVALRQILPPGYAFSVDANIDMGTPVSFQGGRPWRDTLRAALAPAALTIREQGQMVSIGRADAAQAPQPSADSAPPERQATGKTLPLSTVAAQTGMEPEQKTPTVMLNPTAEPIMISGGPGANNPPLPPEKNVWSAERGDNLKKILDQWCHKAGVEFDWLAEYDYPLQASVSFSGTFEDAVRSLLAGFEGAHPQPVAELHSNPSLKQVVLIVQTRGNSSSD